MDSADRFSSVYQRVSTVDPLLDENRARPTWGPAADLAARQADTNKTVLLKNISQRFGIWFFFRSDCSPCHQLAPILHTFGALYGFTVLPVSVDHRDMPSNPWQRYVNDQGHVQQLQVQSTPTLLLASKTGDFFQISDSVISIEEMSRRIIEIAANSNVISEEQYASTRATSKQLMPSAATLTDMPQSSADDPRAVRDYLKAQLRKQR
jgi:conjugal transfer pilus assembly protein TraF